MTTPMIDHVDLPAGLAGWIEILRQVKAKRAELDKVEERAREEIQAVLGEREEGRLDGRPVVRWTHTNGARRFDSKAFGKDHPKLYEQYVRQGTPGRRFTLVAPEDGA